MYDLAEQKNGGPDVVIGKVLFRPWHPKVTFVILPLAYDRAIT